MRAVRFLLLSAVLWPAFVGCSKKEPEAPPPPAAAAEQTPAPANPTPAASPAPVQAPAVQVENVQQVNANFDAVSKDIAAQNYENAVRTWVAMDQAQRQAQVDEAVRQAYARRAYQLQEALRIKAETDAKAREAYKALGRQMMGR